MFTPIFLAEAAEGGGALARTAQEFGITSWLLLSQVFSFSIVCILLHKFAYKPILTVLEQRRATIEQGLTDAARIKSELADAEKRSDEIVQRANGEAQRMIDEARTAAKSFQDKQTQQAIAEAGQIIAKARETSRMEHERMYSELKSEVARLVVDTTAKVSGKVLTNDDQRRLSDEASREIAA